MSKYRAALIGCSPGRGIAHGRAFVDNPDKFDLVAICDKDKERLDAVSAELTEAKPYADAEEMMSAEKPDILCFSTLPQIRYELIELGIRHGVKLIAYEKPMAADLPEARKIYDACREAGVKTVVSHQHKYDKHWCKVKDLAQSGEIGDVHSIHASAKGWMLHWATHLVDYTMFVNGPHKAKWVMGHIHGTGKGKDNHPSPDQFLAVCEFENGVRATIECGEFSPTLPPGDNSFWMDSGLTAYGSEGYARVVAGGGWWAVTKSGQGMIEGKVETDWRDDQKRYVRQIADWLDDEKNVHPCNAEVTYHGFEIVMGACISALDNRKVDLPIREIGPVTARFVEL